MLHLSYSDGISTVSVFEQRGRLAGAGGALPIGWTQRDDARGRRSYKRTELPYALRGRPTTWSSP